MNRRNFLRGSLWAIGGSLFIGKDSIKQEPIEGDNSELTFKVSPSGELTIPGFFTVFVDGKESFRMVVGDEITAERDCHVVAFSGFENKPSREFYLRAGDSLIIYS